MAVGIRHADHVSPSIRKVGTNLALQAAVARSVWFARGLRPRSLVFSFSTDAERKRMELEFFLRPTDSRPVRLGIGPPFGTLDQILSCSFFC
jgi:hypothetical protein